jgi:hypothetical protein
MVDVGKGLALTALAGLLGEFRKGHIVALADERRGMETHTGLLTSQWNEEFPGFPSEHFPYTSFWGQHYRGRRDAHLRDIVVRLLADNDSVGTTIVNPACVFGRHACALASRLEHCRVIGTDIDPRWYRYYKLVRGRRIPDNYRFVKDNIFDPYVDVKAAAVVFFGACGAVTDGAIDYAVALEAPLVMCRTCCHDNIGGNLEIVKRFNPVNRFFRFKNWAYGRMRGKARYRSYYFSEKYARAAYPRSEAARSVSTSDEFMAVAKYSPDSDICRAIIDLDRYLLLAECGYKVRYQGELLVAVRKTQ